MLQSLVNILSIKNLTCVSKVWAQGVQLEVLLLRLDIIT